MHQIIFFSKGGNTKKVADAIAGALGTGAVDVNSASLETDGIVFLGSGCYGGEPSPVMMGFISKAELNGRKVALFGTSGGGEGREVEAMSKAIEARGARVLGRFNCKGKTFKLLNRGHPSSEELAAAREFARDMVRK